MNDEFFFVSEPKALLPFVESIDVKNDDLTFQFYLDGKTLFNGIHELPPGHSLTIRNGHMRIERYWEVCYELDWDHTEHFIRERMENLIRLHLRSDVPVESYLSIGLDSSIVSSLAAESSPSSFRPTVYYFVAEGN